MDNDDIQDALDDLDIVADEGEPAPIEVKRTVASWKAVILTGLLAGLIGTAGGGFAVYSGLKAQSPAVAAAPDMSASIAPLKQRITELDAKLTELSARPTPTSAPQQDLSGIEARLDALESAPPPEIDPEALSALQAAQADGFEWPDTTDLTERIEILEQIAGEGGEAIMERLESLETDFLAANVGDKITTMEAERVDQIEARLAALESAPAPTVNPVTRTIPILPFPKEAMIKVVEANMEGGFMKKTLSRHIRVKDEDDPRTLIDAIEADIKKGRLREASERFQRLPEPVKAAGKAWHASVKAAL